jgi:hypothetical protein
MLHLYYLLFYVKTKWLMAILFHESSCIFHGHYINITDVVMVT